MATSLVFPGVQFPDLTIQQKAFPSFGIIMWFGSIAAIPAGWLLCDGTNGTPDLRDRFVVGAGSSYAVGSAGGLGEVYLLSAALPPHTHTTTATVSPGGAHVHPTAVSAHPTHSHPHTTSRLATGPGPLPTSSGSSLNRETIPSAGSHAHTVPSTDTVGAHTHPFTGGATGATGAADGHNNLPPYYALVYLQKA